MLGVVMLRMFIGVVVLQSVVGLIVVAPREILHYLSFNDSQTAAGMIDAVKLFLP